MSVEQRFRIRTPWVANQIIDGEAVLIAFETGAYYSAQRTGANVLSLLEQHHPVSEIVARLTRLHDATPETIAADVWAFVGQLSQEGLIVALNESEAITAGDDLASPSSAATAPQPWEPPLLTRYSDLEDLLILDPIHEVDDAGWPVVRPQAA